MRSAELFPADSAPSFVAIGDSFTEGMNDPAPGGGFRGWADRLAGMLAVEYPGLRYANLAIRGKLLRQVVHDQIPAALDLLSVGGPGSVPGGASGGPGGALDGVSGGTRDASGGAIGGVPWLVSLAAGGNDILRPGSDPDTLAELFDAAVARLRESGCQVLMFTGFDPKAFPVMRLLRGRIAAYNMHLRAIADDRGCYLVDLWSMRFLRDPRAWSPDRLHLASQAHHLVALRAAEALGLPITENWREPSAPPAGSALPAGPASRAGSASPAASAALAKTGGPLAVVPGVGPHAPDTDPFAGTRSSAVPSSAVPSGAVPPRAAWLAARREDARWAKEYLVPWIGRRLHGTSSGDGLPPKRPSLQPVPPTATT